MKAEWVDGFEIRVTAEKGETVISANREGILLLMNASGEIFLPKKQRIC